MKPENFLLGQPSTSQEKKLFLVDLGLGKLHVFQVQPILDFILSYHVIFIDFVG